VPRSISKPSGSWGGGGQEHVGSGHVGVVGKGFADLGSAGVVVKVLDSLDSLGQARGRSLCICIVMAGAGLGVRKVGRPWSKPCRGFWDLE
jgi:hypothetical protein